MHFQAALSKSRYNFENHYCINISIIALQNRKPGSLVYFVLWLESENDGMDELWLPLDLCPFFFLLKYSICSDHVEIKSIKPDQDQCSTNAMTFATKLCTSQVYINPSGNWGISNCFYVIRNQKEVRCALSETDPLRHGR